MFTIANTSKLPAANLERLNAALAVLTRFGQPEPEAMALISQRWIPNASVDSLIRKSVFAPA